MPVYRALYLQQAKLVDRPAAQLLSDATSLTNTTHKVMASVDASINELDLEQLRRREVGYRRWHQLVFVPLNRRLRTAMNKQWFDAKHHLRQEAGDAYIAFVNQVGGRAISLEEECPEFYCAHGRVGGALSRLASSNGRDQLASRDFTLLAISQPAHEERTINRLLASAAGSPMIDASVVDDMNEIMRPGSKDFRVKDSRQWTAMTDADIFKRKANKSEASDWGIAEFPPDLSKLMRSTAALYSWFDAKLATSSRSTSPPAPVQVGILPTLTIPLPAHHRRRQQPALLSATVPPTGA